MHGAGCLNQNVLLTMCFLLHVYFLMWPDIKCLITFEYADDGVNHIITVGNDGPPIPSEIIEKIFEPFFTTKARGEGTGLGLNIIRKIIEKHKGTIICQSEDSVTKFIVSLPKSN